MARDFGPREEYDMTVTVMLGQRLAVPRLDLSPEGSLTGSLFLTDWQSGETPFASYYLLDSPPYSWADDLNRQYTEAMQRYERGEIGAEDVIPHEVPSRLLWRREFDVATRTFEFTARDHEGKPFRILVTANPARSVL